MSLSLNGSIVSTPHKTHLISASRAPTDMSSGQIRMERRQAVVFCKLKLTF